MARRPDVGRLVRGLIVTLGLSAAACTQDPAPCLGSCVPAFSHIGVVVFENAGYESLFGFAGQRRAPYLNSLAARFSTATRYYGIGHASLPNYVALVSGQAPVPATENDCPLYDCLFPASTPNLGDQLEAAGRTWKAYLDGMPATCAHGRSGEPDPYVPGLSSYATRHNPFVYFRSIVDDTQRCATHDVPYTELARDLASDTLPDFFLVVPDLCHGGHSCPLAEADAWAAQELPRILTHPGFVDGGVLFVTFDEAEGGDTSGCCGNSAGGHVGLIVASPTWGQPAGFSSSTPHNHYSLLRTIEDAWGLAPLGHAQDSGISSLSELFVATPG